MVDCESLRDPNSSMKFFNITQCMTITYRPFADDSSERTYWTLQELLRCYCIGNHESLDIQLSYAEFKFNNTFCKQIYFSSFFLVHGCHPCHSSLIEGNFDTRLDSANEFA